MGKSAKFYKKPSLKEKQGSGGKNRSSVSTGTSQFGAASPLVASDAVKKAAVTGKAIEKRQMLEEKTRKKEEATKAPKPVFRPADQVKAGLPFEQDDAQEEDEEDLIDAGDDAEIIKRRPRNRQRKDWGPMPKEMGVDYLKQWDSRHS